ncbi:MAG: hypothetical protein FJ087_09865 [Deltaproteobacteria bacterium]|nr:hypothetical protein [Deltaproteobacteria bacterium]
MDFEYDGGVRLSGSILWLDATRHDVLSFVSSARMDDAWRHGRCIATDRTRALLRVRHRQFQALVSTYGQRMSLGPLALTLIPAGFMPGSAQVVIEADRGTALYASNVCLEPHGLAEPFQVAGADVLVLKAAYGRPSFVFPPRAEALARVVERARETIAAGRTPVFLTSPIGKAQEAVRALAQAGLDVAVHKSIAGFNRAYCQLGFDTGRSTTFRGRPPAGGALVFPDRERVSQAIRKLKNARLFWLSGRAVVPDVLARMRVDEGIPLAGHLDHPSLMRFVERTRAKRVYAVGVWAGEFAQDLRGAGVEAHALHGETQLTLF